MEEETIETNNKPFGFVLLLAIAVATVISFCLSLTSCYTPRKANRQFVKVAASYPEIPENWPGPMSHSGASVPMALVRPALQ